MVRLLTRAAGMPTGNGGKLDWHKLVRESGLSVVSLHTDLGSVERGRRGRRGRGQESWHKLCRHHRHVPALLTPMQPPGTTWQNA